MTPNEIKTVLELHNKWRVNSKDGERAYLRGAYLRGADLMGADLRGADLNGAYLRGADLRDTDLRGADLMGADLRGAYLRGAYLRGAYLRGADLMGADLRDTDLIDAGEDRRGYRFVAIKWNDGYRISAGCRWFTAKEARIHWWADTYQGGDQKEIMAKINMIETVARARGWSK